ncbi:MAG: S26 family signal peptidase [Ilumatobacteraceae bacterium]
MREDSSADIGPSREVLRRATAAQRRQHPVIRQLATALLLLVIAAVIYAWPASFGGRSTIVFVSGTSMLPTLTSDDVVFAREHANYAVGDLVVFRIPDGTIGAEVGAAGDAYVIHRIVGGSESTGWVTKGDNRNSVDPWFLGEDDIVGLAERKASIGPAALTVVRLMLTPLVWAAVAALVVFAVAFRRVGADPDVAHTAGADVDGADAGGAVESRAVESRADVSAAAASARDHSWP